MARGNPLKYTDPTGHQAACAMDEKLNWSCNDNAVTGGETQDIDLADDVDSKNPNGTRQFLTTMGGAFIVAFTAPYAASLLSVACADGDCTNEVDSVARTSQSVQSSVWQLNPYDRGVAIENMLGRSSNLVQNFPVIDRFQNGVATSIKSLDLGAKSYQNVSTLTRTVQGYVDTLANWQGQPTFWGGVRIFPNQITARVLELAIPTNATQAQLSALQQIQQNALNVGVNVQIIPIQ